jgi:hypothetical protein
MKKLIAISVMCALVAGAAFADTTVGGSIFVGGQFVSGDNVEGTHLAVSAIGYDQWNTLVKVTFGDNDAGGWFSLHNNGGQAQPLHWFGWWKPTPKLRFQIGRNADGNFGTNNISGWGFTGEAKNVSGNLAAMPEYGGYQEGRNHSRNTGWYLGTDAPSFQVSLYPIEGLTVNLFIPFNNTEEVGRTYTRFEANIVYRLTDIGNIAVSFQSNTGYKEGNPDKWYGEDGITDKGKSPKIFASFYLTAIENMGVDLGLAYKLPFTNEKGEEVKKSVNDGKPVWDEDNFKWVQKKKDDISYLEVKTNNPIEIGLGYRFGKGDLGFKLRSGISLGGKTTVEGKDPVKDPTEISVNILPSYKIKNVTVYLYAGLGIQMISDWEAEKETSQWNKNESNALVGWFVNPYILIPAGGVRFLTGVQIWSDGAKYVFPDKSRDNAQINWAIPFGFYAYF